MIAVCQKMTAASSSTPIAMISSPVARRSPETPSPPCAPSLAISAEPELFENTFDALFLQRRRVDALLALVGRNGNQPELAGLDLLGKFAVARNARRHLVAKQ